MRRILTAAVLAAATALSAGCAQTPPPVSEKVQDYYEKNSAAPTLKAAPDVTTFTAVGDSVTLADSKNFGGGVSGSLSWVTYAATPTRAFAGGFGSAGATSEYLKGKAVPTTADVAVIVAGTNDTSRDTPFEESAANIAAIAKTLGAKKIVVSAIPPSDKKPAAAADFNASLEPFVKSKGWTWVDPWVSARDSNTGAWLPGLTPDGLHPVKSASEAAGKAIGKAIGGK